MSPSATPAGVAAPAAPRKRQPWLLLPAGALALFLLLSAAAWLYARARLDAELTARLGALARAGWTARVEGRRWSGFPFRLKLTAGRAVAIAPDGWGAEATGAEAQAVLFDPRHWVFAAPGGLILHRGASGAVRIEGRALNASVSGLGAPVPRWALVGEGLRLQPLEGARPTTFRAIGRWEAYLRPAPDGSGDAEALWQVAGALAAPHTLVWNFAPEAPVAAAASARIVRPAAFAGPDRAAAARSWAVAGGALRIGAIAAQGGPTRLDSPGGVLVLDGDGRLQGVLPLSIVQRPVDAGGAPARGAAALGEAMDAQRGESARGATRLVFESGVVRLGGLKVGPSPKVG